MNKLYISFILVLSINVYSKDYPPGNEDKYFEFSFSSFNCNYHEDYPPEIIENILDNARNGNSQAAYFLFYGSSMIKNKNIPGFNTLLQQMIDAGNPHGLEIKAIQLFREAKYKEGLFLFERAAEMGVISIITHMHEIYSGEKYPMLKNESLAKYWWRRSALSGNIYSLKQYIHNNPEKLKHNELRHWQDAYESMIEVGKTKSKKKKISEKTKLLINQININRERIAGVLKKHHPWYGDFKYCNK